MTRIHWVFVLLLFALVGCTDTIDTMSREYRNTNNEALDALMMVTDEPSANLMTRRVFKQLSFRYKAIDEKIKVVETNRTKKDLIKEMLESDGFQIYLSELEMNRMRFSMEINRIRGVMALYGKEERARLDGEGKQNEEVNYKQICPAISDIVSGGSDIEGLKQQLMQPKLFEVFNKFPGWKDPAYPLLFDKFMKRRETTFATKEKIVFIN